jgi:hypothetical protein
MPMSAPTATGLRLPSSSSKSSLLVSLLVLFTIVLLAVLPPGVVAPGVDGYDGSYSGSTYSGRTRPNGDPFSMTVTKVTPSTRTSGKITYHGTSSDKGSISLTHMPGNTFTATWR